MPRDKARTALLMVKKKEGPPFRFDYYPYPFSPIEGAFSKVKGVLRRVGARTREALLEATSEALDAVSARDAAGWFGHCGYRVAHHPL